MSITIAISGKGGSGKTTLSAMLIRLLCERAGKGGILGVDADPNSCLGLSLGVEPVGIVADIREKARAQAPSNAGMDKVRSVEYGIQQAVTEADGFDLLTMGRPEGPSCYCAVNNMLRKFLDQLSTQYRFVVVDNEAGMEHLSRRTTNNVDMLCIVSEPTAVGSTTARRIFDLAKKLPIVVKHIGVVWSRTDQSKDLESIETIGYIPYDQAVSDASMKGKTVFDLQDNSPALAAARKLLERILVLNS